MGFYSCFYAGRLFKLQALASKIGCLMGIFDDDLISAASQSQIDSSPCQLLAFGKTGCAYAKAHGQCDRHLISDLYRLDILQDIKSVFTQLIKGSLRHGDEKLVLFKALYDGIIG